VVWKELEDMAEEANDRQRDRWIGVFIGILAVALAVCALGGGNATKNATLRTMEASNTWAFFQAKNMRRQIIRVRAEELETQLATDAGLSDAAKAQLTEKLKTYRDLEKRLTSEPETGEGLDELFVKGKAMETARDIAMRQDPYFDYAQALLQIAIVLASVAIIAGGTTLLFIAAGLGLVGVLLTINGFTLLVHVPLIG
jgi:hypothetical protein